MDPLGHIYWVVGPPQIRLVLMLPTDNQIGFWGIWRLGQRLELLSAIGECPCNELVYLAHNGVWWCVSSGIHTVARTQGLLAKHYIVTKI